MILATPRGAYIERLFPLGAMSLAALAGLGVVRVGSPVRLLPPVVLLLGLWGIASRHLQATACVIAAAVVLVPAYSPRTLGPLSATPAVAFGLVLLPAIVMSGQVRRVRATWLDGLFCLAVVTQALSIIVNYASWTDTLLRLGLNFVLPYVALRPLAEDVRFVRRFSGTLVATAAALTPVAVLERVGRDNPFLQLTPIALDSVYAGTEYRGGLVRAEASFGQPLIFGMFLGVALVLGFWLGLTARRRSRLCWAIATLAIFIGLLLTASRSPLFFAVLGVGLVLFGRRGRLPWFPLLYGALLAFVGLIATPLGGRLARLLSVAFRSEDATAESSQQYRALLLDRLFSGEQFSWLGQPTELGYFETASARAGLVSIDNEFLIRYFSFGAASALTFAALFLATLLQASRRNIQEAQGVYAACAVAGMILVNLALLLQNETILACLLALAAASPGISRGPGPTDAAPSRRLPDAILYSTEGRSQGRA